MSPELETTKERDPKEKQLEVGTWGAFFVWLGVSLLAPLAWGVWLGGVGVIILGAQLARRVFGLPLDGFWLIAGVLFVLGGISEIAPFEIALPLIPLLCIIAGLGLLARALAGGAATRSSPRR
jgi:hypothetical protein